MSVLKNTFCGPLTLQLSCMTDSADSNHIEASFYHTSVCFACCACGVCVCGCVCGVCVVVCARCVWSLCVVCVCVCARLRRGVLLLNDQPFDALDCAVRLGF